MRPNIDDLIVSLAGSDNALAVLLLDFVDLLLRGLDLLVFLVRDDHVVNADGDTRTGGLAEAKFLELVEHHDGARLPDVIV